MKKVFFNAYLCKNFGDDLFVHVVTSRYPEVSFTVLADDTYEGIFGSNVLLGLDENYHTKQKKELKRLETLSNLHLPTRLLYPEFFRNYYKTLYRFSKEADLPIYVIGSAFMENDRYRITSYLADYLYYRKHPIILSCNFGPYHTDNYLKQHRKLFAMTRDICWRDTESFSLFSDIKNMRKAADIVFNYDLGEEYILPEDFGDYILISVVSPNKNKGITEEVMNYINFLLDIIKESRKESKKVVLVGFCKDEGDFTVTEKILETLEDKSDIFVYHYPEINYRQVMGLFLNATSVVASRYHAMVIGFLYQKNTYVIAYSDKTINVIRDIDPNIKWADTRNLSNVNAQDFLSTFGYRISDEKLSLVKESASHQFDVLDEEIRKK
ncbi:polysaccharide pyruvyl transferase family protein [Streptococcus orisratti]